MFLLVKKYFTLTNNTNGIALFLHGENTEKVKYIFLNLNVPNISNSAVKVSGWEAFFPFFQ